ncbi:MAG TPA: FliM/FliN family flagellar motor switch protein [Terriglobia bacterium]|nr:FliM/FliN family flagellar motor switch protein [Terriglobia bacterium]
MEKILSQEEIDALIRAAQNRPVRQGEGERKQQKVTPCSFGQAGRMNQQQVGAVSLLHDTFARNLSERLGAYLRVLFEAALVSVEQLPYNEFLQRIVEMSYVAAIDLQPFEASAVLHLDASLAFPAVELLLGGEGKGETFARDITEIEEQILESVSRIICDQLQLVWQPLIDLQMRFYQRQKEAQVQRLMGPNESVLALSFEIRLPDARGTMNLAFPGVVSSALLRKMDEQWMTRKRRVTWEDIDLRRRRLQQCRFPVEVVLPAFVRGGDLVALRAGQTLILQHRIGEPLVLNVASRALFTAYPVRVGGVRAATVDKRLLLRHDTQKESI